MGKSVKFLLLGDATVGQEALLRFYVLHVVVLPTILTIFVAVHFWRIRKDGGLAKPEEAAPIACAGDGARLSSRYLCGCAAVATADAHRGASRFRAWCAGRL